MLTITLGSIKEFIRTADGKSMVVLSATVLIANQQIRLNEVQKFDAVDDVEIMVQTKSSVTRLDLEPATKKGIIEFLTQYHAQTNMNFDCYAFANLVQDQPVHKCTHMLRFWDIKSATELGIGGTVFFLDADDLRFRHAAIYLGSRLFVSVYGAGGDLEFSTFNDMESDFGASDAAMALPRKAATP